MLISERALKFPFVMMKSLEHCPNSMPKIFAGLFKVRTPVGLKIASVGI